MRKWNFLYVLAFLSLLTTAAFADDDSEHKAPLKVGYVIVTPVPDTQTGLVVFESFGHIWMNSTMQAGVRPAEMTTDAMLFANSSGRLSRNLGVAITNPGSTTASITLTLIDDSGAQKAEKKFDLTAGQQIALFVTEMFPDKATIPHDFSGSLYIHATSPVAVIGLRFRDENFSAIPITNLWPQGAPVPQIATGVGGANAVILPHFAAGGGWASELILANTGTAALTVRVDLFDQAGKPLDVELNGTTAHTFTGLTIQPHGVLILAKRDRNGDSDF